MRQIRHKTYYKKDKASMHGRRIRLMKKSAKGRGSPQTSAPCQAAFRALFACKNNGFGYTREPLIQLYAPPARVCESLIRSCESRARSRELLARSCEPAHTSLRVAHKILRATRKIPRVTRKVPRIAQKTLRAAQKPIFSGNMRLRDAHKSV